MFIGIDSMRYHARLYQSLLDDLEISADQPITSDCSVDTVRRIQLARSFLKKCTDEISEDADKVALDKFVACNDACRTFELLPRHLYDDEIIGGVKAIFDRVAFDGPDLRLDLDRISSGFGLGPGANIGCESYDFFTKLFDSQLSRTEDRLYRLYRCAINGIPSMLQADDFRSAHRGNLVVAGSKMSFVPKSQDVSRTICTEPTLNMLFQKGIGRFLEDELKRLFRIDLSKQPALNCELARQGSVEQSYGTIDLSSASDSISMELCRQLLPGYLYRWLELTRSPITQLQNGDVIKLEMISSMGNGFTFPLQTLIFASLVVAVYGVLGIKPEYTRDGPSNFAVFGDDIIVRKDAYLLVTRTLEMFGFVVNVDKSFNNGPFRESCGSDFFCGHNVRGVYIKELKHETDFYSAFNRCARWAARSGVELPRTLRHLLGQVPPNRRCLVPLWCGDAEGIHVPLCVLRADPRLLARPLMRFLAEGDKRRSSSTLKRAGRPVQQLARNVNRPWVDASSIQLRQLRRAERRSRELFSDVFVYIQSVAHEIRVPTSSDQKGWTRGFGYNPEGLLQSFVAGFIRNGRMSIRSDRRRTKVSLGVTSSWDDHNGAPERVDHGFAAMIGAVLTQD